MTTGHSGYNQLDSNVRYKELSSVECIVTCTENSFLSRVKKSAERQDMITIVPFTVYRYLVRE